MATTAFAVFAVPHASADEIFTYTSANYSGSLGNNITASATLSCAGACLDGNYFIGTGLTDFSLTSGTHSYDPASPGVTAPSYDSITISSGAIIAWNLTTLSNRWDHLSKSYTLAIPSIDDFQNGIIAADLITRDSVDGPGTWSQGSRRFRPWPHCGRWTAGSDIGGRRFPPCLVAQEADGYQSSCSRLTKIFNLIWRGRREAVFLFALRDQEAAVQ